MAPERFEGWSDPRSDVYGLGVTLYELLTLRPAFDESDRARADRPRCCTRSRPPPRKRRTAAMPRDLETIVLKAMAKEPADRYATARALAEDLRRFLEDRPILARPATAWERAVKWARRRPVVASLAALLVVALVTGATVSTFFALRATQKASEAEENARKATEEAKAARAARKRSDHLRYVADINLAHRDIQASNLQSACQRLQDLIPQRPGDADFRHFEWDYLQALCHRELVTLEGGQAGPGLFSPDGRRACHGR